MHGAVVGIADREGIGQRELVGQLLLLEIAHGGVRLGHGPARHAAVVPGLLTVQPGMRSAGNALRIVGRSVQMIGRDDRAVGTLLLPDLAAVGHGNRHPVAKAAHPLERAEVLIEGAVFLHQDHHMLHVHDRARDVIGGNGQRTADAGRKGGQCGSGKGGVLAGLQKIASRNHGRASCLSLRSGSTAHLRLGRLGGGRGIGGIGGGRRGRRAVIAATTGGQRGGRQAHERQRLDQTLVLHGVFRLDVDRFRPARI